MLDQRLLLLIPAGLLVAVIIAVILIRGDKKIDTEKQATPEPVITPTPTPSMDSESTLTFKVAIPKPAPMDNTEILKAIDELRKGLNEIKIAAAAPHISAEPIDPNIDPMEVVHRVDEYRSVNPTPIETEPLTLFEKATKIFWQFAPGIFAVLITLYLLQGYVSVKNYAADSKGLNDRIVNVENSTTLSGVIRQINTINTDITSIKSLEPSYVTTDKLAAMGTSITQLQNQLQALQNSITALQKSQNITGNVTK